MGEQEHSGVETQGQKDSYAPQSGFVWDEASGYYYDAASGFYYDGNTGFFLVMLHNMVSSVSFLLPSLVPTGFLRDAVGPASW